jgi:hypothetical protein
MRLASSSLATPKRPGQAIHFDFEFNASLEGNRQQLRTLIGARGPASPDQHLKISIEVFDGDTGENAAYTVLWGWGFPPASLLRFFFFKL